MSKFLIQYTVEALNIGDATSVAYELLYAASIDAEDVKVLPVNAPTVRTFDEPSDVSDVPLNRVDEDFKRNHPWGV